MCPTFARGQNYYDNETRVTKLENFDNSDQARLIEIKIAPSKLTTDISYNLDDAGRPIILGEGRYGYVYKAMYEENCVAVKCIKRKVWKYIELKV